MAKILYRYYCRVRPPAPGAIPKRNLYAVEATHFCFPGFPKHFWGYAEYTKRLTSEEIEEYELVPAYCLKY